ncbi:MAG: acetyl-CoA carboxylase carboxyltransferase subunit alpha [Myxococcota bacterium]
MDRDLEFERPIRALERQIAELKGQADQVSDAAAGPLRIQIARLEEQAGALTREVLSRLGRWDIVQLARHPKRPYTLDYIEHLCDEFQELHGDRSFADDPAIVGGLGRIDGRRVMIIGHQKGRTTQENIHRNFGMPRPEGYRKAIRLMAMAERFDLPLLTMIDTPGAFPGIEAEARGQSQAIAEALERMAALSVPVVAAVIGEGGSGGALAVGVANRIVMLQFAIYSVISPEGCASILFKDAKEAPRAAEALRLSAPDLLALGVIDEVIEEPEGGAHRAPEMAASALRAAVLTHIDAIADMTPTARIEDRYARFRRLGALGAS